MNWVLTGLLAAMCVILLITERRGVRTTLQLSFRGDLKRETAFLAQYGQAVCTPLVFILVWQLDERGWFAAKVLGIAVGGAAIAGQVLKRLLGRVRPNRPNAGRFLGPDWRHAGYRESFPSNHTATAVALSVVLVQFYPGAAITFWLLAGVTAGLRYLLDAHFPSDVIAGVLVGYLCAHYTLVGFGIA